MAKKENSKINDIEISEIIELEKKQKKKIKLEKIKEREIDAIIEHENKDFSNKDLSGLTFSKKNLQGANFRGSKVTDVIIEGCDLRWSSWFDAYTNVNESGVNILDRSKITFRACTEQVSTKTPTGEANGVKTYVEKIEEKIVENNLWEVAGLK